jgi:hypothetical protein
MRTLHLPILAAAALAAAASAQVPFEIYPGVTSFTSRGNVGAGAGELHQGLHSTVIRGLGDNNGVCEVRGVFALLQDQDRLTQGTWRHVIRSGTEATGPGTTAADVIASTGPLLFPASTLTGAVAYGFTTNFATPVQVPCESFWSIGIEVVPEAWSTDGVSMHAANNTANLQHANAEDMGWQIIGTAATATNASAKRSWRVAPLVTTALQAANVVATAPTDRFGIGGFFPDTALTGAASQGLSVKVGHPGGAAAQAAVFLSLGFGPQTPVAGFGNSVYMNLGTLAPFAVVQGPADGSVIPFITAGLDRLPAGSGATVVLQAVVVDTANAAVDLTNAVGVVLN